MTSPNYSETGKGCYNNVNDENDEGDRFKKVVPYEASSHNDDKNPTQYENSLVSPRNPQLTGSPRGSPVPIYQSFEDSGAIDDENYANSSYSSSPSPPPPPPEVVNNNNYSVMKVRVALILITSFASAGMTMGTVLPQYLLQRWSDDAGHSRDKNHTGGGSNPCIKNTSDPWNLKEDHIQARVSLTSMHYTLTTSVPALVTCLMYGALVDIIGRRPALICSMTGSFLQVIVAFCIIRFKLDTDFFFLAFALDGLGGSFYVFLIAGYAITADISAQKDTRILGLAALGLVFTTMYAGFNVTVGILLKKFGFVIAVYAVIAPYTLALFIAVFLMPETLPTPKQKATLPRLWDYTKRVVFLYSRDGSVRTRRCLLVCLVIFFCGVLNYVNIGSLDTLYQKHAPLCWDAAQIGYYLAFRNSGGYTIAFVYLFIWRCVGCASDEVQAMVGMLFIAGSNVLEAFVTKTWQMYMVPVVMSPGGNLTPILRGVMSVLAGPDKQGVMFSSIALIEVLCSMTATIAFNKIYAYTVTFMPGFVYLVMAGNSVVAFLLFIPFFHYYDGPPKVYEKLVQAPDEPDALTKDEDP